MPPSVIFYWRYEWKEKIFFKWLVDAQIKLSSMTTKLLCVLGCVWVCILCTCTGECPKKALDPPQFLSMGVEDQRSPQEDQEVLLATEPSHQPPQALYFETRWYYPGWHNLVILMPHYPSMPTCLTSSSVTRNTDLWRHIQIVLSWSFWFGLILLC